jgi:hypothetical protein
VTTPCPDNPPTHWAVARSFVARCKKHKEDGWICDVAGCKDSENPRG